jgi:hypothetical protein
MARKKEYTIEQSPFYNSLIKTRTSLKEIKQGDDLDLVIARKRYFKQDEYTKCITTSNYDIFEYHNLNPTSKTLLQYIINTCLEYNTCTFRFIVSDFKLLIKCNENTVFAAINELIKFKYVARTKTKEIYWINHNKYYKGNFLIDKFYKEK